jgi:hypothetical protein
MTRARRAPATADDGGRASAQKAVGRAEGNGRCNGGSSSTRVRCDENLTQLSVCVTVR